MTASTKITHSVSMFVMRMIAHAQRYHGAVGSFMTSAHTRAPSQCTRQRIREKRKEGNHLSWSHLELVADSPNELFARAHYLAVRFRRVLRSRVVLVHADS